ncbi:Ethanolamine kinase, putative [Giardia lamblia P15]|uniref:Ethanolamine kinase, putative n=1 Tax=Giardia intestinalis (strain P15) TaxID=658858 RepID=E1F4A0_GIAIA|nr:Ethanolamine kinase, putative [Giardia lamblia P15]
MAVFKNNIALGKSVTEALEILERELGSQYCYCKTLEGCSNEVHIIKDVRSGLPYIMRFTRQSRFQNYSLEREILSHVVGRGVATSQAYLFADGIVAACIEGHCVESDKMLGDSPYYELIAKQMRRLHEISVQDDGTSVMYSETHYGLKSMLDISVDYIGKGREAELLYKLYSEDGVLGQLVNDHPSLLWTCISHNDLHSGNIIYSPSAQEVRFIDWEYSTYSINAFDIACFFLEFTGIDCEISAFPCASKRQDFYLYYFGSSSPPIDFLCLFFIPLACLFWAAWSSGIDGLDVYTKNRTRLGHATLRKLVNEIWPQCGLTLDKEDCELLELVDFTFQSLYTN